MTNRLIKQVFVFGSLFLSTSFAAELTIIVYGMDKIEGNIVVGLFAEENADKFPSDDSGLETILFNGNEQVGINEKVTASSMEFTIEVPDGTYAVSAYQDINADGKLGKIPFIGLPTEPYGFSNSARGLFGPPDFRESSFSIEEAYSRGGKTIELEVYR